MRLFIPPLGTRIRLIEDWSFEVNSATDYDFRRWAAGIYDEPYQYTDYGMEWRNRIVTATLVAGTVLGLERIYIRKTKGDYDSLTFRIYQSPDRTLATKKMGGDRKGNNFRFFASLEDCNRIDFDLDVPDAR
jgi:hypothetical protein